MDEAHEALLQANLALYEGDALRAQRHLQAFYRLGGPAAEDDPMALWLDAQTQFDPDQRLVRLRALHASAPLSTYGLLAQAILAQEDAYQAAAQALNARLRPRWPAFSRPTRRLLLACAACAALALGLLLAWPAPPSSPAEAMPAPAVTLLPDLSLPLDSASFRVELPALGLLELTARENDSRRVVDSATQRRVLTPLSGARFFALQGRFECRTSICAAPPQAQVRLLLDDGGRIAPRADARIIAAEDWLAVALGRSSSGWWVFEIPLAVRVRALDLSAPDGRAFPPLRIELGE